MAPKTRHGVHSGQQANFRLDPGLLARLRDDAKRHGQPQTDIVSRGITAELDRLDRIATSGGADAGGCPPPEPVPVVAAEERQPQRAGKVKNAARKTGPAGREPENGSDIVKRLFASREGGR